MAGGVELSNERNSLACNLTSFASTRYASSSNHACLAKCIMSYLPETAFCCKIVKNRIRTHERLAHGARKLMVDPFDIAYLREGSGQRRERLIVLVRIAD